MLLAAAAVGVLFVGGAAGAAVMGLVAHPASVVTAGEPLRLAPVADSGVNADVSLVDTAWGTRLDWTCSYPKGIEPGHDYELVVVDAAGIRRVVATWTGDGKPRSEGLTAATSTPRDDIARIELTAAPSGTVLAAASN